MRNGSYMVYRRLEQLVPEFDGAVRTHASSTEMVPDELGSRIVGRFKSGWPVAASGADDPVHGASAELNNDFDFNADGLLCPFAAHIRKAYPRNDPTPGGGEPHTQTHRFLRAGIPLGPEVQGDEAAAGRTSHSRGLMFVCYQTSIENQFEFAMSNWINNRDFLSIGTGEDPLLGQAHGPARSRTVTGLSRIEKDDPMVFQADFVRATGGGYFFMPSITAINTVFTAWMLAADERAGLARETSFPHTVCG